MNKLIISALLIVGLVGIIGTAAADPLSTTVMGTIFDQNGDELSDAKVTVHNGTSCTDPQLAAGTSDSVGYYSISIGPMNVGDVVTVCAVHAEGSGSNSTEVISANCGDNCNLNIACTPVQVPEFSTIAIPIAAILGLMFIISSRKKKE